MTALIVLQARTSSSRLPGKVLLPIGGMPLSVLAAKRAGNTGQEVVVATSADPSDDVLAQTVGSYGLTVIRGPLENTLGRFVLATQHLQPGDIVIRLTADNVFPDGTLIDEMIATFERDGLEYLACDADTSGLPYGVRAEVFHAGALRDADRNTVSAFDREHVTPWIIRRYGRTAFDLHGSLGLGLQRATIDQLDDYLRIAQEFMTVDDPLGASFIDLSQRLALRGDSPVVDAPVADLVVGTAQLGTHYGIANRTGTPDTATAQEIVHTAIINGVEGFDTARAYGESEAVLGRALADGWSSRTRVFTKIAPFPTSFPHYSPEYVRALTDKSLSESELALRGADISAVLLHRASMLTDCDGAIWQRLLELMDDGRVKAIGVSVQTPDELRHALEFPAVTRIQMPFNLLDWRWTDSLRLLQERSQSADAVTVHVRSTLLQGLLVSKDPAHWRRAGADDAMAVRVWLERLAGEFGRESIADLAINYVRAQSWCSGVIVGMETKSQLLANIKLFDKTPLSHEQKRYVEETRPRVAAQVLDPAKWSS
ncbi:aldo/keto reductase [Microbacterium sp.]|uniref:aldo/keto reductase n=1 Tax=Microbacterium sp. TaxID=51671 RepID=UPI003A8F6057